MMADALSGAAAPEPLTDRVIRFVALIPVRLVSTSGSSPSLPGGLTFSRKSVYPAPALQKSQFYTPEPNVRRGSTAASSV